MRRIEDLPAGVRMLLFGVVVVAVLFIGFAAMRPGTPDTGGPANPEGTASAGPSGGPSAPVVPTLPVSTPAGDPTPTGPASQAPTAGPDADAVVWRLGSPVPAAEVKAAARSVVAFTETFLSYSWDQDPATVARRIEPYLASSHMIDLARTVPTGTVAAQMRRDQTQVVARVATVQVTLVSAGALGFEVATRETTRERGRASRAAAHAYSLTLIRERGQWAVQEIRSGDSDLHAAGSAR